MDYRKEYKDKIVLITGGAGCIGSNLVKTLLKLGVAYVVIIDNLSASKEWNIPKDKRIIFIWGDIACEHHLQRAFNLKPELVFHLAAHFANQNSIDYPELDLETNGTGTLKVLKNAEKSGIERFVYASSGCSVYGSQAPLPLKEDYVSIHLDTPYQIHKLLGELYCNFYHNYYKLPIATARFFNVFGQGEMPGQYRNVIPNFIWWAIHGKPLPITGTGEETRDFTYVGDIVDGLLRMGVMKEAIGEAFNLASGVETKIVDIANIVNEITRNKKGVEHIKRRDWDKITRRRASIDKAKEVLGYNPQTNIADGIKEAYNWIVEHKEEIEKDAKF